MSTSPRPPESPVERVAVAAPSTAAAVGGDAPLPNSGAGRIATPPWPLALRERFAVPVNAHAIHALDGVRGFAAILVFAVHYHAAFGYLLPADSWLSRNPKYLAAVGFQGLNLFFVLSGLLIYGALIGKRTTAREFLARRLQRIYPVFLAVLALYLLLSVVFPDKSKLPDDGVGWYVLQNLLLLPGVFPIRPIITVAWSLSFELFFYLGITALVLLLRMRDWTPRARVVFWLAVLATWALSGTEVQQAVRSFVMFVPGILLAEALRARRERVPLGGAASLAIWGVLLATIVGAPLVSTVTVPADLSRAFPSMQVAVFFWLGVVLPGFLFFCARGEGLLPQSLSRPFVRDLGIVSYSFYLMHGITINGIDLFLSPFLRPLMFGESGVAGWALFLALSVPVFILCLGTGRALFGLVERRYSL